MDEIEDFIAEDDYETAVDFVDRLISLGESLTDDSVVEMGTPVSWSGDDNVRELYYEGYTLVYELCPDGIYIHEVYNQRRVILRYGTRDHR